MLFCSFQLERKVFLEREREKIGRGMSFNESMLFVCPDINLTQTCKDNTVTKKLLRNNYEEKHVQKQTMESSTEPYLAD